MMEPVTVHGRKLCSALPLSSSNPYIRVLTYNLLADIYIQNREFWPNIHESLRDWEGARRPLQRAFLVDKLVKEGGAADVLCLQEADTFKFEEDFGVLFKELGLDYVQQGFPQLSGAKTKKKGKKGDTPHVVSCIVVYNKELLELVAEDHRSRSVIVAFKLRNKEDDVKNSEETPARFLYVINVHLEGHPYLEDQRFLQVTSSLKNLKKMVEKFEPHKVNDENNPPAVLICGDFNSTPAESLFKMLYSGKLEAGTKHPAQPEDVIVTNSDYVTPFKFQCAVEADEAKKLAEEGQAGEETLRFSFWVNIKRRLDFVWFTPGALDCKAVLRLFEDDELEFLGKERLPNLVLPSDHLPVGCILQFK
jgi:mRNA deadenylase 3'-5' endonuclease subunit Ccr4